MLIPMAGVIVSRLSSNSFEELTFHRRKPWQNLIDVAELDRNATKREGSQENVSGREEM